MPERRDVEFTSEGETCAAWHYPGAGDGFEGDGGRPCVVMAHGLGGTRDSGLEPFAEAFADAGLDALLFDYRTFGASSGEPRQFASPPRHRRDYENAVAFARGIDGVDPDRIVLWGTSWSGGHVIYVAVADDRIAAVISQTPDVDGLRTLLEIAKYGGVAQLLRTVVEGLKDGLRAVRKQPPHMVPSVAAPGEVGAMTSEDAKEGYLAIAGPTFRNEVTARAVLYEGQNRPIAKMADLRCPILLLSADRETVASPGAVPAAAWRAKGLAEVREYDCAHFEMYLGEHRARAIADQLRFLRRHLAPSDSPAASAARNATATAST